MKAKTKITQNKLKKNKYFNHNFSLTNRIAVILDALERYLEGLQVSL